MSLISNRGPVLDGLGHVVVEVEESLSAKHPDLRKLLGFYQTNRRADGLLLRAAVRPKDIVPLLPQLYMAEPAVGGDWKYRLMGTGLVSRLGIDFTGKSVQGIYHGSSAQRIIDLYSRVARNRHSVIIRARFLNLDIEPATGESLQIPMLGADNRTMMVFGGIFFFR